jgi:membrane associated rhomboid family serine protease
MNLWFVVKARAVWLLGLVLTTAGVFAVLYAAVLPFVPALDPRSFLPELPFASLAMKLIHVSAACAVLGALAGVAGVFLSHRQTVLLRMERRRAEDRLRRVKVYRDDELADGRLEPFFGAEAAVEAQKDRRAA